jgi:hypothetical protein
MTVNNSGPAPQVTVEVTGARIRDLSPAARTAHKAILHAFATTDSAPDPAAVVADGDVRGAARVARPGRAPP